MTGPFAFLRRLFVRDEPLTERERKTVAPQEPAMTKDERWAVITFLRFIRAEDVSPEFFSSYGSRLALRHGYADDGTAGLPFYRVTPKGERFLQEFER